MSKIPTLKGITWDHERGYRPLNETEPMARAKIGVAVQWHCRSLREFGETSVPELAMDYDLLVVDHPHIGAAARSGGLVPLDEVVGSDTLSQLSSESAGPSHASYWFSDHQWAFAIDAAVQTSVSRKDLCGSCVPSTWDDVFVLGRELRKYGGSIGIPFCDTDAICCFLTVCANLGDPLTEEQDFVSGGTAVQALGILEELVGLSLPMCRDLNAIEFLDLMSGTDEVAYCPLVFCYSNYSRASSDAKRLAFGSIPGLRGALLGGAGIAVSSKCDWVNDAVSYCAMVCGSEFQRSDYILHGGQPGNRVAWEDEEADRITNGFLSAVFPTLRNAYVRPRHDGFTDFQVQAGTLVRQAVMGDLSKSRCADRMRDLYLRTRKRRERLS